MFEEDLPASELQEMKQHLEDCDECEEERKLIGDLLDRLQDWPKSTLSQQAKAEMLSEIRGRRTGS